jgi:hypothetical protein
VIASGKQDSSFSEEKEAKRLYPFAPVAYDQQTDKSFLVLFFKKEHPSFLPASWP